MSSTALSLRIFDNDVCIDTDRQTVDLLLENFGFMRTNDQVQARLNYIVEPSSPAGSYTVSREGAESLIARNNAELLFILEKDITIELQKIRGDLYFLHGAALELGGNACMIVAPSGSGKSTTAWALLHNGFRYLSDELAPVNLETMEVTPYPHAVCLKSDPPEPYVLPDATLRTISTLHVPVDALPVAPISHSVPLAAVFFLQYTPEAAASVADTITAAEAGARIYSNTLNLLAHPHGGIDAAIAIARHSRCFNIKSSNLTQTCALIKAVMEEFTEGNCPA